MNNVENKIMINIKTCNMRGETIMNENEMLATLAVNVDYIAMFNFMIVIILAIILLFKKTNHSYEIRMTKWDIVDVLKEIRDEIKTLNKNVEKLIDKK